MKKSSRVSYCNATDFFMGYQGLYDISRHKKSTLLISASSTMVAKSFSCLWTTGYRLHTTSLIIIFSTEK